MLAQEVTSYEVSLSLGRLSTTERLDLGAYLLVQEKVQLIVEKFIGSLPEKASSGVQTAQKPVRCLGGLMKWKCSILRPTCLVK